MHEDFPEKLQPEIMSSLQRYLLEHFDIELNELQSTLLLDYFMQELAPFAYNRGVQDAQAYFSSMCDDLPGVCFRNTLTYWETQERGGRTVARKPDR